MRLRRTIGIGLAAATAAGLMTAGLVTATQAAPSADRADAGLREQLTTLLGSQRLAGASVGLTVRNVDNGKVLFRQNGSTRLTPASNTKMVTSTAALDILGPSYRFSTDVRLDHGTLYLRGGGDPTTEADDYDALAAKVAKAGVHKVRRIVADDSWFDDERLAPFWNSADESDYYNAEISALTVAPYDDFDAGTVLVDVHPAKKVGGKPRVTMTPPNHWLKIRNTATTGSKDSDQTVSMVREHGKNILDVTGSIPLGSDPFEDQPTVDDPTGLAAELFARSLAKHGVRSPGAVRRGVTPAVAKVVARHRSIPLSQLLVPWLKLSNNMISEHVAKAIGRKVAGEGTWDAGVTAILADVAKLGVDSATLQQFDGSGLGRADYNTTDQLTNLLAGARKRSWFPTWYAALPIAGNPDRLVGGTLRNRMQGTPAANNLHGKTGSLTGVSALSGYITDAAGHHLVFSMISNNFVADDVKTLEDAVAVTIARNGGSSADQRVVLREPKRAPSSDPRAQLECTWNRTC